MEALPHPYTVFASTFDANEESDFTVTVHSNHPVVFAAIPLLGGDESSMDGAAASAEGDFSAMKGEVPYGASIPVLDHTVVFRKEDTPVDVLEQVRMVVSESPDF